MKPSMRTAIRWLPPLTWMAIIWMLSSRAILPAPEIPYIDKVFHAGEFGILAILVSWAALPILSRRVGWRRWLPVVIACVFYGIMDEAHQAFVPGRSCDAVDVLADLAGATAAAMIFVRMPRVKL